jgi:tRNA threonylcarbamoyladenosine biosynthesis protein TsaB
MNIIAIETATDYCSVALMRTGDTVTEYTVKGRGVHSEAVFKGIEYVLDKSHLSPDSVEILLLSEGPGSYTGLRVGYSAAKGFLFGHSTKIYTVNTLLSIAAGISVIYPEDRVLHIVIDARRDHLIHQSFELKSGRLALLQETEILPIGKIHQIVQKNELLAGSGLSRIDSSLFEDVLIVYDFPVEARYLFIVWKMKSENHGTELISERDISAMEPAYLTPGI